VNELETLRNQGLFRSLRKLEPAPQPHLKFDGQELLNFSSNDYLGLSRHPSLIEAATKALTTHGTGSTASRLVCGSLDICHELEEKLAACKKTEAALTFANGYATAVGCIPAIVGKGDTIILDKLAHASLIDAARLSQATIRVFPHNDLNKLARLLGTAKGRTLVVTESVFSMDGDTAPLKEICDLKDETGALLFLDEAHGVGVLGPNGQGLTEELDLQDRVDFQMGTLGKALGSAGGYVATSQEWIDLFINKARSFIYSTAPPPSQIAASLAALEILGSNEGQTLRARLQENIRSFCADFSQNHRTPIIPVILGENEPTLEAAQQLMAEGIYLTAIRYPTVPRGTARLRITLSAAHNSDHLDRLKIALRDILS